jgi:Glyoxalase-like domain
MNNISNGLEIQAKPKLELDHLVIAAETLEAGSAFVFQHLGLEVQAGGRHERMGTHNGLLRLNSGTYLEVIAVDPDGIKPKMPRWFGLDSFAGPPRLVHWVVRLTDGDLEQVRLPEQGLVHPMTRGAFSWRITIPGDGSLPGGGLIPTLIAWDAGSRHPSSALAPSDCNLVKLQGTHPEADQIKRRLETLGIEDLIGLETGPISLRATLRIASEMKFVAL